MKRVNQAIEKLFKQRNIPDIYDFIDEVRKVSKSKRNDDFIFELMEEYLLSNGTTDIAFNHDNDTIVYRELLFADTCFRVQLTEEEFTNKNLVIGHRFLPFIHPNIPPSELFLIDEDDNEIQTFTEQHPFIDCMIYFSLLPPYGLQHYDLDNDENLNIVLLDLTNWMQKNDFTIKDNLLISPIDYAKNIFRLNKLSSRDIATQKIICTRKDENLVEEIEAMLFDEALMLPIDLQLFQSFACCEPHTVQNPGTPLGPFISNHKRLDIYNNGAYSYLNSKENMENMFDSALDDAMFPDFAEMGTATDIPGIFAEMGNSFTEDFIAAKMIEQLHEAQKIDADEIYRLLFKQGSDSFYNEEQEKNFGTAFKKLAKKQTKLWGGQKLTLPKKQLLSQTLKLKMDVIGLLRDIDARLKDPQDFDFSMLMQLQPFENITDNLLELLTDPSQEEPPATIRDLTKQVKQMREEFQNAREFILEQL